jgi:hypothetical protein
MVRFKKDMLSVLPTDGVLLETKLSEINHPYWVVFLIAAACKSQDSLE